MFCLLGIPVRCFVAERDDFEPSLAPPSAPPPPAARPPAGIGHHPWKSAITKDLNHANTNISVIFYCVCVFFFSCCAALLPALSVRHAAPGGSLSDHFVGSQGQARAEGEAVEYPLSQETRLLSLKCCQGCSLEILWKLNIKSCKRHVWIKCCCFFMFEQEGSHYVTTHYVTKDKCNTAISRWNSLLHFLRGKVILGDK